MIEWDEVRVEQDLGGGWTIEMFFAGDEIQSGPTKVLIRPTAKEQVPAGGVSSTVLRRVNFRAGATAARELLAAESSAHEQEMEDLPPQVSMDLLQATLDTSGVTDVYLVLLATEYLARVARGEAKPVDHIAEELGRSLGTIKNHLWKARSDGFLQGGSAGRKGGFIPPEAAQIALDYLDDFYVALKQSDRAEAMASVSTRA